MLGDLESAAAYAERELHLAERVGTPIAFGRGAIQSGDDRGIHGQVEQSAIHFERAQLFLRQAGQVTFAIESMSEVGGKWLLAGEIERAVVILDESISAARQAQSETSTRHRADYSRVCRSCPA